MKLKKEVTISSEQEDQYIFDALQSGMTEDVELIQLVMEQENTSEAVAGFRLAQFVLDYEELLEQPVGHMIIEE